MPMQEYHKSRHSAYLLHAHIVFVTKFRKKVFGDVHLAHLQFVIRSLCEDIGVDLKECNGEFHHIHLLIEYPPTVQLIKLVTSLKSVSSRRMRGQFSDLRSAYRKPLLWSRSYFMTSCGGAPLTIISEYVKNQRG